MNTQTYALASAKAHLSELVDNALDGIETVIARHGRPVAKIVPLSKSKTLHFGGLKGTFDIPDDFDAPLSDDVVSLFEGND